MTRNGCPVVTRGRLEVGIGIPPELKFKIKFNCIVSIHTCNDLRTIYFIYSDIVKDSTCINS